MTDWIPLPLGLFLRGCHLLWKLNFMRGHRARTVYWYSSTTGRDRISRVRCECGRVFWDERWYDE